MVQWIGHPAAEQCRCDVRSSIYKPYDKGIVVLFPVDAECCGKVQIRAIGTGLIPPLDGSANRTSDDGEVEGFGLTPFVENFIAEVLGFLWGKSVFAGDVFIVVWILGYKCTFAKEGRELSESFLFGKSVDLTQQDALWDSRERIFDSVQLVRLCLGSSHIV